MQKAGNRTGEMPRHSLEVRAAVIKDHMNGLSIPEISKKRGLGKAQVAGIVRRRLEYRD